MAEELKKNDSTTTTTETTSTATVSRPSFRERVLPSASKLAFLGLTLTACVAYLIGRMETTDFMVLASMAFSFYFANKGEQGVPYVAK